MGIGPHPKHGVNDMKKRMKTDYDFEAAFLAQSPVFVKHEMMEQYGFIGGLESFNPIFVNVGGRLFLRDECEFTMIR
ncbi:hypothetical protein PAECIP111802_03450 [Paenibacillus allorhizosphaerae]|uniref:Uncharacterized protein n=2 Tax=Paenibacillus allorhizosphaerae TaxID=2849866 RepID=A0ABN7TL84_9BACL|nr:hypothetical protein PAECIP111802_03450 [Paenibacillus allorhizosphaerae]